MAQDFDPLLLLQAFREWADLNCRLVEEEHVVKTLGSYQNEKIDEAVEWISEAKPFMREAVIELTNAASHGKSSVWFKNMLLRIRKVRSRRGPNFFFRTVSDVGSTMPPLSSSEECYFEIVSLINFYCVDTIITSHTSKSHEHLFEVAGFLDEIRLQLENKVPETNSDWYHEKTAKARMLMAKLEPAFFLQSQDLRILSLQEKLRCEIRSLIGVKCADLRATALETKHLQTNKIEKEFQERKNEVNEFLTEINLQIEEKFLENNSDWYCKKIAEARTLIVKNHPPQYQIFLSFRGEDTRYGFTRYLYNTLHKEGLKIFMDDEGLQRGDSISQVLKATIENSKLSLIVFSEKFAESAWCLDEVAKIVECYKKNGQIVWPIFYQVEPTDVRHQTNSYQNAMLEQETKFGKDSEKMKKWRSSLFQVSGFKAFHYKKNSRYEGDFIQEIVNDVKNIRDQL